MKRVSLSIQIKAWAFLFLFIAEITVPGMISTANANGNPSYDSFMQADNSQWVDPFTGDFSYNIPVMLVPGSKGSFPLNLHYRAGISPDQEASWVGLGWHLNPGAITRQLNGIPDDFSGEEKISQTRYRKPDKTFSLKIDWMDKFLPPTTQELLSTLGQLGTDAESDEDVIGEDSPLNPSSNQIYVTYNNYHGFDLTVSSIRGEAIKEENTGNENSFGGFTFSSHSHSIIRHKSKMRGMMRDWKKTINNHFYNTDDREAAERAGKLNGWIARGKGYFMQPLGVSSNDLSYQTLTLGLEFSRWKKKAPLTFWGTEFTGSGIINIRSLTDESRFTEFPAFGSVYPERGNDQNVLHDCQIDITSPPTKRNVTIGAPMQQNDSWFVSGPYTNGAFRAHSYDFGVYTPPFIESKIDGVNGGFELGTDISGNKLGADLTYYDGSTTSGPWSSDFNLIYGSLGFDSQYDQNEEPFYFQMNGELTAQEEDPLVNVGGNDAFAFPLEFGASNFTSGGLYPSKKARVIAPPSVGAVGNNFKSRRNRMTLIGHMTFEQKQSDSENSDYIRQVLDLNNGVLQDPHSSVFTKQIAEFTTQNSAGYRQVFGMPVYNLQKSNVSFRVDPGHVLNPSEAIEYVSIEGLNVDPESTGPQLGFDHFFSRDDIPEYSSEHLLTELYSNDYVDFAGDGPTADDAGFWVQLQYQRGKDFTYRMPYAGRFVSANEFSNEGDDLVSYTYGKTEQIYVQRIETDTHYAVFTLSPREDNRPVIGGEQNVTKAELTAFGADDCSYKLDRVTLWQKVANGPDLKIQTTHFLYDYLLCPGTHSSAAVSSDGTINSGKLTLIEVYTTYQDSQRKEGVYKFNYNHNDPLQNPSYSVYDQDVWGNYDIGYGDLTELKYSNQYSPESLMDAQSAAWSLKSLESPGGSLMRIEYEADRYQYVQDEQAMAMFKIVGFSDDTNFPSLENRNKITKNYRRVWFELPDNTSSSIGELTSIVGKEVYIKSMVELKALLDYPLQKAQDFVECWAKVSSVGTELVNQQYYGYVDLEPVNATVLGVGNCHPIQLAAWEDIRLYRQDLLTNIDDGDFNLNDIPGWLSSFVNGVNQNIQRIISFYPTAKMLQWGSRAVLNNSNGDPLAFIRLPVRQSKYGGGHRVKSISVFSGWEEMNDYNGQSENVELSISYDYLNRDGLCSGVAINEPMVHVEENALVSPVAYNNSNTPVSLRSATTFTELPLGLPYYPMAAVGYSHVVIRSNGQNQLLQDQEIMGSGVQELEFYTAKDYPTKFARTILSQSGGTLLSKLVPIPLPYTGWQIFQNQGFSQGICIETNDMHGKLKSQSNYSEKGYSEGEAQSTTSYLYWTDDDGNLSSLVDVMTELGYVDKRTVGVERDFLVYAKEFNHWNADIGGNIGTLNEGGIVLPNAQADVEYVHTNSRIITNSKVIRRSGLLREVVTLTDGSWVKTENEVFCSQGTGVLLTTVDNEWRENVYSYSQPAYPYYDDARSGYLNYRQDLTINTDQMGVIVFPEPSELIELVNEGDELLVNLNGTIEHAWIEFDDPNWKLIDEEGQSIIDISLANGTVIRPARRNLSSSRLGTVISLSDPLSYLNIQEFLQGFNDMSNPGVAPTSVTLDELIGDPPVNAVFSHGCDFTGDEIEFRPKIDEVVDSEGNLTGYELIIDSDVIEEYGPCRIALVIPFDLGDFNPNEIDGSTYLEINIESDFFNLIDRDGNILGTAPITSDMVDWFQCIGERCVKVLHADATSLSDQWADTYFSQASINTVNEIGNAVASSQNPYRYGMSGIERPEYTFVYRESREQSSDPTTRIDRDGLYSQFKWFDWRSETPLDDNPDYIWKSHVDRYTLEGVPVQSSNPLGVPTASLTNIEGSQVIAESVNALVNEVAFESFELGAGDYSSVEGNGNLFFPIGTTVSDVFAHTGDYSLEVPAGASISIPIDPLSNSFDEYHPTFSSGPEIAHVSVWAYVGNEGTPKVRLADETNTVIQEVQAVASEAMDGWVKLEFDYTYANDQLEYLLQLSSTNGQPAYFDDLRICPKNASMATYVYSSVDRRLVATLDNNNYATVYVYDRRGQLVQTKVETVNGIQTVSTGRTLIQNP
ncbi:hypothetical protein [Sanyastnella coralliicola]|uniref:hypothetical protein n=1 Tax=Sanyastnella coralliicola TaxID=3069118 RepID=UPI0027B91EE9|nr:hypothetical protein [Longitalea sp. SCSIO 12813]